MGRPGLGSVVWKLNGWPGAVALVGFPLGLLAASECSDYVRAPAGEIPADGG